MDRQTVVFFYNHMTKELTAFLNRDSLVKESVRLGDLREHEVKKKIKKIVQYMGETDAEKFVFFAEAHYPQNKEIDLFTVRRCENAVIGEDQFPVEPMLKGQYSTALNQIQNFLPPWTAKGFVLHHTPHENIDEYVIYLRPYRYFLEIYARVKRKYYKIAGGELFSEDNESEEHFLHRRKNLMVDILKTVAKQNASAPSTIWINLLDPNIPGHQPEKFSNMHQFLQIKKKAQLGPEELWDGAFTLKNIEQLERGTLYECLDLLKKRMSIEEVAKENLHENDNNQEYTEILRKNDSVLWIKSIEQEKMTVTIHTPKKRTDIRINPTTALYKNDLEIIENYFNTDGKDRIENLSIFVTPPRDSLTTAYALHITQAITETALLRKDVHVLILFFALLFTKKKEIFKLQQEIKKETHFGKTRKKIDAFNPLFQEVMQNAQTVRMDIHTRGKKEKVTPLIRIN